MADTKANTPDPAPDVTALLARSRPRAATDEEVLAAAVANLAIDDPWWMSDEAKPVIDQARAQQDHAMTSDCSCAGGPPCDGSCQAAEDAMYARFAAQQEAE